MLSTWLGCSAKVDNRHSLATIQTIHVRQIQGLRQVCNGSCHGPLWWMASVEHWLFWHFDLSKYRPQDVPKVKVSLAAVTAFGVFGLLPLLVKIGPLGFLKWWVVPTWLGFHFWMSTFSLMHRTAPHIPFKQTREWNAESGSSWSTMRWEKFTFL